MAGSNFDGSEGSQKVCSSVYQNASPCKVYGLFTLHVEGCTAFGVYLLSVPGSHSISKENICFFLLHVHMYIFNHMHSAPAGHTLHHHYSNLYYVITVQSANRYLTTKAPSDF